MLKIKRIVGFVILLILIVVLFYFWGGSSHGKLEEYTKYFNRNVQNQKMSDTILVMSYNIGYMSGMTNNLPIDRPKSLIESNLAQTIKFLEKKNPDIIGFQEIDFNSSRTYYINQIQTISDSLNYTSYAMAVNWDKRYVPFPYWPFKYQFGKMYSGQGVVSRFNIIDNDRIVLPVPESNAFYYNHFYLDRLAQITWLQYDNSKILVINVHFEAWDGLTREKQATIVLDFYRKYSNDFPTIIIGDFNCTPPFVKNAFQETTIQQFINEPGLEMSLNIDDYRNQESLSYTFNSEAPFQKIDYIFFNSKFFSIIDSGVSHEAGEISDHLPIFAELLLKP